ncbi:MAG: SDR family NAD(P)-dependent oxidoreductase [Rhodanobacteraceae bacterium]|nr:SDR family NAD(P)-dependent oxidoreductase [Rhodanobacteraceae bacterium]
MSELLPSVVPPADAWSGAGLGGRQILVVGANGALGRACALAAADRGASVVLLGRRVAALEKLYDEIEALGAPQPAIYPLNLEGATPAEFAELGARILDGCGRLDGVICAAGRLHGLTPIEQFEPEEWLRTLQVGVNAPFLLLQSLLPALRASSLNPAVMFFVDEIERSLRAYWGAYGVAQAALRSLIGISACEWEGDSVRTLGLLPAPLASAFRRKAFVGEPIDGLVDPARYASLATWILAHAPAAWSGAVIDARQLPAGS